MASIWGSVKGLVGADQFGNMTETEKQIAVQKHIAQNQTKWNMEGLQNAGLNPILAVGGPHSAGTAANVGANDYSSSIQGITSAVKVGATIAMAIATKNPSLLLGIKNKKD